jgi:SAM-dependent methyltransferase
MGKRKATTKLEVAEVEELERVEEEEEDNEGDEGDEGDAEDETDGKEKLQQKYTWHFDMLHDGERNKRYHQAIESVCKELGGGDKKKGKGGKAFRVLDIGTGSGLLAMLAAKGGATGVTAIEQDPVLASLAVQNAANNGMENVINVHNGYSTAFTPTTKANLFVSELLDSALLGEDFLPILRDAQARLLTPDAKVIPARAKVYAQLVESETLHSWQYLKGDAMGCRIPADIVEDYGPANPAALDVKPLVASGCVRVLSEPFLAFDFDFQHPPSVDGRVCRLAVPTTATGQVHAVLFWWSCDLDAAGKEVLSNAPGQDRDHWTQAVSFVKRPVAVEAGQQVKVLCAHNDDDIWFPMVFAEDEDSEEDEGNEGEEKVETRVVSEGAPPMPTGDTGLHDMYDTSRLWSFSVQFSFFAATTKASHA